MNARVSCLTPSGSAAIAVIAVRGDDAWPIIRQLFRPASMRPLPDQPEQFATWFGHIGDGVGDEVILAIPSLQPEPTIEIHCHGGQQVVRWLIELFTNAGCAPETREAATQRVSEAERSTAEAWGLLPYAKTLRTAGILLDQANGAFARALAEIDRARTEGRHSDADELSSALLRYESVGRHLIDPWKVVISGVPNAGKSSLLNALAGYQRSVVAHIPGTTRDVVTVTLAFDGWPVEIADTAGLREMTGRQALSTAERATRPVNDDDLEAEGIARARKQLATADLCLWVIDSTGPEPQTLYSFAAENNIGTERVLPILNKIDQPPAWDLSRFTDAIRISATAGTGIDALIRKMVDTLVPDPPPAGAAVPFGNGLPL